MKFGVATAQSPTVLRKLLASEMGAALVGRGSDSNVEQAISSLENSASELSGGLQAAQAKMSRIVLLTDFGAVGDGETDDTVAIQAALDGGGRIIVPPGSYRFSGPLTVKVTGTMLEGAGEISELVYDGGGADDWLTVDDIGKVALINIALRALAELTTGAAIKFTAGITRRDDTYIDRVWLRNVYNGIDFEGGFGNVTIKSLKLILGAGDFGIRFRADPLLDHRNDNIRLDKCVLQSGVSGGSASMDGLLIEGQSHSHFIKECAFLRMRNGIRFSELNGETPTFARFSMIACERASNDGLRLDALNIGVVENSYLTINGSRGATVGAGSKGSVTFIGNDIRANGSHGIQVAASSARVIVTGGNRISSNGVSAPDTYNGINIAPGAKNIYITGNIIGGDIHSDPEVMGNQRFGVAWPATADYIMLRANDLRGNASGDYNGQGDATVSVGDNFS